MGWVELFYEVMTRPYLDSQSEGTHTVWSRWEVQCACSVQLRAVERRKEVESERKNAREAEVECRVRIRGGGGGGGVTLIPRKGRQVGMKRVLWDEEKLTQKESIEDFCEHKRERGNGREWEGSERVKVKVGDGESEGGWMTRWAKRELTEMMMTWSRNKKNVESTESWKARRNHNQGL